MAYYIDPRKYHLDKFQRSLESREMIPSRQALKQNLQFNFDVLRKFDLTTLDELLKALNSKPKIAAFAEKTGLSADYLTLLRREANSYFPTPTKLSRFSGVNLDLVEKLEARGIKSTRHLFDAVATGEGLAGFAQSQLSQLISLSDLSRLYGVGPAFASMLLDADLDSVQELLKYSGEEIRDLYEEKTGRTADFTARDIDFTLEIARELESSN